MQHRELSSYSLVAQMDGMEGVEKEVQEGKDMYLIHFVVQEKPTQHCKEIIL